VDESPDLYTAVLVVDPWETGGLLNNCYAFYIIMNRIIYWTITGMILAPFVIILLDIVNFIYFRPQWMTLSETLNMIIKHTTDIFTGTSILIFLFWITIGGIFGAISSLFYPRGNKDKA
jgi:ABC-type amino acid transport system permease subunit